MFRCLPLTPLAVLVVSACGAAPSPLLEPPRPAAAPIDPTPVNLGPPALVAAPSAAPEPAAPAFAPAPEAVEAPKVVPRVLLERPYSALGHARLGSEMLTLGRDEELFQWALGGSANPEHPSNRPGYHPATRVVVDVQLLSRAPKGSTARLLRLTRSRGYWPLRSCFENAQRVAPKSERSARVRLTLGATGRVLGARNLGPIPERDYARCVLERVRGLDFTPGFTRKLDIEVSVKQWPGHAPVPPRAPDGAAAPRVTSDDLAALERLAPALTACYEKALTSDATLWGRVAFKLELTSEGSVKRATPVETQFPNAEVSECARQTVSGARFASPGLAELTWAVRFGQPPAPPAGTPPEPSPPFAAPDVLAPPAPSPPAPPAPEQ
jgi:hypothetical protein